MKDFKFQYHKLAQSRMWKHTPVGFFSAYPHQLPLGRTTIDDSMPWLDRDRSCSLSKQSAYPLEALANDVHPEFTLYYRIGRFYIA